MKKLYLYFIVLTLGLVIFSCQPQNNTTETRQLTLLLDSLRTEIKELKQQQQQPSVKKDTVLILPQQKDILTKKPKPITTPKPVTPVIKKEPAPKPYKEDTIYHKYKNGTPSVTIFPRHEGRRKILVYNRQGKITIELEEVIMSYQVTYDFNFREDGSVNTLKEHTNPGTSRYWYDCQITFSNNNEPEWKKCEQFPMDRLEHPNANKYYWNKSNNQWVKQEYVEEQPYRNY
jgi:hypothetical protein